mmetsp:Transcript_8493/g.17459  ORF Transcript_8493/g.17459 Transcript_8493/m.17459 type:complete len:97 (+) Transcript_8493:310-600(+)
MGGNDDGSDAWTYAVDDAEAADIAAINSSPFSQSVFPSPLMFSFLLLCCLALFVGYLILPRGVRFHYFRHRGRRYRWSAQGRASQPASVAGSVGGK